MLGPPEHVESIQFLDEAQILSVVWSENGIRVRLDKGVTSNALEFKDTLIFQGPKRYNVTQVGSGDKLLFWGSRHLAQTEKRRRAGS